MSQIMLLLKHELGRCTCVTCNKRVHFTSTCAEALLQYVTGLSLRFQVACTRQEIKQLGIFLGFIFSYFPMKVAGAFMFLIARENS